MFAASRLCAAATKSVVRGPSNTFTAAIRYLHLLHLYHRLPLQAELWRCARPVLRPGGAPEGREGGG